MSVVEEKTEELRSVIGTAAISGTEIERMNYRLSDAIREGCSVTNKAEGWLSSDGAVCALSAAVIAATARGIDLG